MNQEQALLFRNKKVKLTLGDHFVLQGIIIAVDEHGVIFQTRQKTSFINFNLIGTIIPEDAP